MTSLFNKLNLPPNFNEIIILNEPEGFDRELALLEGITITESLIKVSEVDFALVFVTEKKQIENRIETLYPKLVGDAILWFAFPKKTSTKYTTKISNNIGWGVFGDYQLQPVNQISINDDWSAIRFRKISFIPKQTRVTTIGMNV